MSETPFRTLSLFVFSGTGNAFRAATWLLERAQAAGVETTLRSTNEPGDLAALPRGPEHLLGLLSPTHGFTAPWHVIKFACRLPAGEGSGAFVMVTRAGTKFDSIFLPGMEGTAGYLLGLILLLKGYRLRGVRGLDMPSNWLVVHPGFGEASARAIIDRAQPTAEGFLERILSGHSAFGYGSVVCLALGIILAQVSLLYITIGRLMLSKLFFASANCTGCGECAAGCPVGAIRMWGSPPRPYWKYGCESCMRCMAYCPVRAVQAGHSWAVALFYLTSVPVTLYLSQRVAEPLRGLLAGEAGHWLVQVPYALAATAAAYGLLTLLLRVPLINHLFTYTTLTRFWRRYHAPGVSSQDLQAGLPAEGVKR